MYRVFAPLALMVSLGAWALSPPDASAQATDGPLVSITGITIDSVSVEDGGLVAQATVTLDVLGRTITLDEVTIPLDLGGSPGAEGGCDILNLALGPVHLDVLGLVVDLDDCNGGPVTVDIVAQDGEGLLGDLLCSVAGLLDDGLALDELLAGLPVDDVTALTDGLTDILNGVLDQALATAETVAPASHQSGQCDILNLELQDGVHLSLLGLDVDTSGICLDVSAQRGGGNLLGNLLCGISHLLDSPGNVQGNSNAVGAQTKNINKILDRLGL